MKTLCDPYRERPRPCRRGAQSCGSSEAVWDETGAGGAVDADLPRCTHTYSGMLPGYVAGHYDYDEAHIDLGALARFANARFYHSAVTGLDLNENGPVRQPSAGAVRTARSIRDRRPIRRWCRARPATSCRSIRSIIFLTAGRRSAPGRCRRKGPMRIAVVGAGAGGVEILLAIQHRLGRLRAAAGKPPDNIEFHLFSNTEHILPTHNTKVRAAFLKGSKHRECGAPSRRAGYAGGARHSENRRGRRHCRPRNSLGHGSRRT